MSCTKCNEQEPCVQENCTCQVIISTDCVTYTGDDLTCSGIIKGTILTDVIKQLDEFICSKFNEVAGYFRVKNIGDGARVYANDDNLGTKQFRSFKKSGTILTIAENTNDITYGIDTNALNTFVESNQKTYNAESIGTGQPIYKTPDTVSGDNTKFNIKSITTENSGVDGVSLLKTIPVADTISIIAKKIKSDSLDITGDADNISIELPTDANNVTFYVNPNSIVSEEIGTISKPFKSLKAAFNAFKGTGTILNPQYAQIGVIELLSDVVVPSTGGDAMTYISMNQLRIKGNGNTIYYRGTQDYFISTEYLVGLDPKTTLGKLDNTIFMSFRDVNIISETVHKMIYNLNYVSPSTPGFQNSVGIEFLNCEIYDTAYLEEQSSYVDSGVTLFGSPVLVQNTLDTDNYVIVNKDANWYGEGGFTMRDCRIVGCSSTLLHNLNTSTSWYNVTLDFNGYNTNYETISSSVYSPKTGLYYILNENDGTSGRDKSYIRIENFKQTSQQATSGGLLIGNAEVFCKIVGDSQLIIDNGTFYSDRMSNIIQIDSPDGTATLNYLDTRAVQIADATYGAFRYTGSLPVSPKFISVEGSNINFVKNWTTNQYIRVFATNAVINGSSFGVSAYASNSLAIAGGLVPGNFYINTSGGTTGGAPGFMTVVI